MKKALPSAMFADVDQARLTLLRNWVLDHQVSEIQMIERQFWIFAQLQPLPKSRGSRSWGGRCAFLKCLRMRKNASAFSIRRLLEQSK
jgi:hypothetical protein